MTPTLDEYIPLDWEAPAFIPYNLRHEYQFQYN